MILIVLTPLFESAALHVACVSACVHACTCMQCKSNSRITAFGSLKSLELASKEKADSFMKSGLK